MSTLYDADTPAAIVALAIRQQARHLGFDLVGIAPATPSPRADYLRQWLHDGKQGMMQWLADGVEKRIDPRVYMASARSLICLAINYHTKLQPLESEQDKPTGPQGQYRGKISRHALGQDYHEVVKKKLYQLADWIRQNVNGAETRVGVDTAPIMEKSHAARSGIGWQGKNTLTINPKLGSWLLLGVVVTNLDLPVDEPAIDRCGSCTRCIDACPTGAIIAPYQLDARRCITYLTIEHRDEVPQELKSAIGDWLYGCDICQEVCPYNMRAPDTTEPAFQPRFATGTLATDEVLNWTDEDYRRNLRHSAMKRVKLPMLKRNAAIVAENLSKRSKS
ncbi:MAG: tRNA epoxyqueuosine(34) reductase QueG [Phycisphaerales bacterium]|nr:tRNA epoxyqueuosine(34) reductase QueG [Phycisphaerales bacterium]